MACTRCLDAVFMIIRASAHLARGPRPCRDGVRAAQVIDEPKLRAARSGRLGFTFVVIAMRCWQAACQMFLPNRTTQRELDIQKRASRRPVAFARIGPKSKTKAPTAPSDGDETRRWRHLARRPRQHAKPPRRPRSRGGEGRHLESQRVRISPSRRVGVVSLC